MRVTVCELPQEPLALAPAWAGLCRHVTRHGSELVLLPEFALVDAVWESERFDPIRWGAALAQGEALVERLPELGSARVIGTRPVERDGHRYNEGYLWTRDRGLVPLRRKYFLPSEPGGWETAWFSRGDAAFRAYRTGRFSFGLNICTELWALESYTEYAAAGIHLVLSPAPPPPARWRDGSRRGWWRRCARGIQPLVEPGGCDGGRRGRWMDHQPRRGGAGPYLRRGAVGDGRTRPGGAGGGEGGVPEVCAGGAVRAVGR